ncbi:MAG: SDR family oxidoreductase [Novosphingobium sp.]|nr:SDR family oxidoreductase [Novosphingobium sp.]
MGKLSGKTAIVTGGTEGIGLAIVKRLVEDGAEVLFCGRTAATGEKAMAEIGNPAARFMRADVSDENDVAALIDKAVEMSGKLDILVNNAAKGAVALIPEHSTEDWRKSCAINLDSVFFTSRAAMPHLKKCGGTIINIASISGLYGDGAYPSYCAQKGAVISLTKAMAVYHAREGVRINALCPGFVETPATSAFKAVPGLLEDWFKGIPAQRPAQPSEMAGIVSFLASDDASYMHGSIIVADGGVTASSGQPTQVPLG